MLSRNVFRAAARAAAAPHPAARVAMQVRAYAAAPPAAGEQAAKPPVAVFGLDGTYATALYTAAVKTSTLDPTAKSIASLQSLVAKDEKLAALLTAPTLTAEDKAVVVAELARRSGGSGAARETINNFLTALAENNRLGLLGSVCNKFGQLMAAARGEVEMVVTSAQPLDNRTLNRLENSVAKSSYAGQGKSLKVTNQVNPDIIGGLIVEIGDRTIDLSVSTRIAKMNKLLTDAL